jgi:ferredoxin
MFRIEIDRSLCSSVGACIEAAPGLLELGADGIAVVRVDVTDAPEAVDAACACPMGAITVLQEEDDLAARSTRQASTAGRR